MAKMGAELLPSLFRSPLHRYELLLDVFEGVNRYLGDVANTLQTGADVLRNPSRLGNRADTAYGTIWVSATDMDTLLKQWHLCLSEAWAAWNALPADQQATVRRPSHNMIAFTGAVFKDR
jgi:hypothetical protein